MKTLQVFCLLTTLSTIGLSGCDSHANALSPADKHSRIYNSEQEAVVGFLYSNMDKINNLTSYQEYLGWVVRCVEGGVLSV